MAQGLSQSTVQCMAQDRRGFLWIGTSDGLNLYDGYGFKVYKRDSRDPFSLAGNNVMTLAEDRAGALWVGTRASGLSRFNREDGGFMTFRHDPEDVASLSDNKVYSIAEDSQGRLWVGSGSGLNLLDRETGRFTRFYHQPDDAESPRLDQNIVLTIDRLGVMWVGGRHGLAIFDPAAGRFAPFRDAVGRRPAIGAVHCLVEDSRGGLWVGSRRAGLFLIDASRAAWRQWRGNPEDPKGLASDRVWSVLEDRDGAIWVGSEQGGLHWLDRDRGEFVKFGHDERDAASLGDDGVCSLLEDRTGVLWAGTLGGGLSRHDPATRRFRRYFAKPGGLSGNSVRAVLEDRRGELWVGTFANGLNRSDRDRRRFRRYRHDPNDPGSLPSDKVSAIHEDRSGGIWVGASKGLALFDRRKDRFEMVLEKDRITALCGDRRGRLWVGANDGLHLLTDWRTMRFRPFQRDADNAASLSGVPILALYEDRDGALWVGTNAKGLYQVNPLSGGARRFSARQGDPGGLSHNRVTSVLEDRRGRLWVGTYGGGLNLFDRENQVFLHFQEADGLPNDVVYGILEDGQGLLWMSTNKGLVQFDPDRGRFRSFDVSDGVQSDEFNLRAYCGSPSGEMFFGGINGLNAFFPNDLKPDPHPPEVVVTELLLLNQPASPSRINGGSPLKRPIFETEKLRLSHRDYVFSFEFAALHFANPGKNRYAYKLEGLDKEWIHTGADRRFASYTKLAPGSYTFRVKASNKDGVWNERGAAIGLYVEPPPWRSWWAYALYALAIAAMLRAFLGAQKRKLAYQRAMVRRLKQVDRMKNQFLANTSHELRTPLNGIIGLAESLKEEVSAAPPGKVSEQLDMIIASGRRLTGLVSDILDFSKMKGHELELRKAPVNLRLAAEQTLNLFRPLVGKKQIALINDIPQETPWVEADRDRLAQIFHNLIDNAIKFTNEGEVRVDAERKGRNVAIRIADTGVGIRQDRIGRVFESFEQGDASTARAYGGTGLGLAVVKQLVLLHGGSVKAFSKLGEGSAFVFTLPISANEGEPDIVGQDDAVEPAPVEPDVAAEAPISPARESGQSGGPFHILVVDDEPVNRRVLFNHLGAKGYRLSEAESGEQALSMVDGQGDVDLVLLDVMMPRMSGYEACQQLRRRRPMQELPVIFLTAKNQASDVVKGFSAGGNDYVVKPIDREELLSRVKTHLQLLDFNRSLECKVFERTIELEEKNRALDAKYQELDTLDRIVKIINREIGLKQVVEALLEQGLLLFPKAQSGSCLEFNPVSRNYRFGAAAGYELDKVAHLVISQEEMLGRYASDVDEVEKGVYVFSRFYDRHLQEQLGGVKLPESIIAMTVIINKQLEGVLLFHNDRPAAFRESDVKKLARFRAHAISAMSKAKALKELAETQKELVDSAHLAGMAEIATEVLHNVGNRLNSVKISAHVIHDVAQAQRWLELSKRAVGLLEERRDALAKAFADDERLLKTPRALAAALEKLGGQFLRFQEESERLVEHVHSIVAVLQEQQRYAEAKKSLVEAVDLNQLIHGVLHMEANLLQNRNVKIVEDFEPLPVVRVEKAKLTRVLFCLVKNAWEAIAERDDDQEGVIVLRTRTVNGSPQLQVVDNGVGIARQVRGQVFEHGFTTKKSYQGFGLHYCANAMREMAGTIDVHSDGLGLGAMATLNFPIDAAERDEGADGSETTVESPSSG